VTKLEHSEIKSDMNTWGNHITQTNLRFRESEFSSQDHMPALSSESPIQNNGYRPRFI